MRRDVAGVNVQEPRGNSQGTGADKIQHKALLNRSLRAGKTPERREPVGFESDTILSPTPMDFPGSPGSPFSYADDLD